MDQSACKEIVDRHLPKIRDLLSLGHWAITPVYDRLPGNTSGQCWPDVDYDMARIVFDSDKVDDEEEVIRIILHELAHLISAPFDLFASMAYQVLAGDATAVTALKRVYTHATEMHAINVERIWRNHLCRVYLEMATAPEVS